VAIDHRPFCSAVLQLIRRISHCISMAAQVLPLFNDRGVLRQGKTLDGDFYHTSSIHHIWIYIYTVYIYIYMEVAWNGGTTKSSIHRNGCSIINHPGIEIPLYIIYIINDSTMSIFWVIFYLVREWTTSQTGQANGLWRWCRRTETWWFVRGFHHERSERWWVK
jgi:hypothetical protein